MKRVLFIGLFVYLSIVLFSPRASAQTQPLNLTTSPHVFDLTANPGDTIQKVIHVRNNNTLPTTLHVSVQKLTPNQNGDLILRDFSASDSYASWLAISQASVSAASKEWTDVNFTITVPKSAAFGYYWAILISTQPGTSQNGATARISGAVAIPVLLNVVKPGAVFDARFLSFQTTNSWYEYLPADFQVTIENKGNVHIKPLGTIFIADWLGNKVTQLPINSDAGSVLPNQKRTFDSFWNDSFITYDPKMEDGKILLDKNNKPQMQVNWHFEKLLSLRMGKYSATALVVVSNGQKDLTYQQTTTFFVFPWKVLLGMLIIVLLVGIGLWSTLRNIWHHGKRILNK